MTTSIERFDRLERELKERADSTGALERVKDAERMIHPKEHSSRPIHRSTHGRWESQRKGGLSFPRRRR